MMQFTGVYVNTTGELLQAAILAGDAVKTFSKWHNASGKMS